MQSWLQVVIVAVVPAFNILSSVRILNSRITYVVATLALPGCTKMPRACLGVEDVACSFAKGGGPVQPHRCFQEHIHTARFFMARRFKLYDRKKRGCISEL